MLLQLVRLRKGCAVGKSFVVTTDPPRARRHSCIDRLTVRLRDVVKRGDLFRLDARTISLTLARTLLETVCKHILAARAVAYDDGDELPRLYRLTAETLQIAPNEATEDAFRRIFGGCTSIVESLGTIRNRMGDAHGRGADAVRVEPRYARLAVNLSGAMATFLVETWEAARA